MPSTETSPPTFPLADADRCVKCGLCLPHCPTYGLSRNEAESPRGRIALMQGVATARIVPSSSVARHLDGCLGCRACESVCPAKVPYGRLIDAGRATLAENDPRRLRRSRALSRLLTNRAALMLLRGLLRLYGGSGLQALLRRHQLLGRGRLARLESTVPTPSAARPWPAVVPATEARGRAQIFIGCVGAIVETAVAADLATLLADCGITATITPGQTCCGAIDQHAGDLGRAAALAERNVAAFATGAGAGADAGPVLPLATGCAASLRDYRDRLPGDADAARFVAAVEDPIAFLDTHADGLRFRDTRLRVAIHEPCTQRNVIGAGASLRRLLARVPGLEVVELDPSGRCCGAAGTHFISHAAQADALLAPKLAAAARLVPDVIVSSNIGCSLHLAGGLRRADSLSPEVLHPLQLLARLRQP